MIFDLKNYVNTSKRKYVFINELLNTLNVKKESILKELGISYDSFRVWKHRDNVNNDNINILLKYFNVNDVNYQQMKQYEKLINEIYYAIYFVDETTTSKLLVQINKCIDDNNFLKPLFILLRVCAKVVFKFHDNNPDGIVKADLDYLYKFKKCYFVDSFSIVYECIMYYFQYENDKTKLNNLAIEYPKLKWIYLTTAGSLAYLNNDDNKALRCYLELTDGFELYKNNERLMIVYSNTSLIYNLLEEYLMSISVTSKCLEYIYFSKNLLWIKNILMHYLYSNYMLKKYDVIIDLITQDIVDIKKINWVSAVICILSASNINRLADVKKVIDQFNDDLNVKLIMSYLKTKNTNELLNIRKTEYIKRILINLNK